MSWQTGRLGAFVLWWRKKENKLPIIEIPGNKKQ
jgi:hypothetical protein